MWPNSRIRLIRAVATARTKIVWWCACGILISTVATLASPGAILGQGGGEHGGVRPGAGDSTATIIGTLADRDDGEPIAFGSITLMPAGAERFVDRAGTFRISGLPGGHYTIRARQIGYSPVDTAFALAAGEVATVDLHLRRIPFILPRVAVSGRRSGACVAPGAPDSASDPVLAATFAQVRANVDRFRLLVDEYPFRYTREELRAVRSDHGEDSTVSVDTVAYESTSHGQYREGHVLFDDIDALGHRVRVMYLPTFRDFGDSTFLDAHCFSLGGTEHLGGSKGPLVLRIDFRPATRIAVPDVAGSIYLDAERYLVRRAVIYMTKPEMATPPILGLTVTTTFREVIPLVPVFDSVETDQPFPVTRVFGLGNVRRMVVEDDRLLGYSFEHQSPGDQSSTASPVTAAAGVGASKSTTSDRVPTPATLRWPLTGQVEGSDGTPVVGATVGVFGAVDSVATTDSGRFEFTHLAPGPHMLWVRRLGFETMRLPITIGASAPTIVVKLVRTVPVLATVVTNAQAQSALKGVGFEQRKRAGLGQYLTYEQIEARHAKSMSQLLDGMRGILLYKDNHSFGTSVEGTHGVGSCVSFVVDGVPQAQLYNQLAGGEPLPTDDADNLIDPSEIGAMEVYSAAARPAGLGGLAERPPLNPGQPLPNIDINGQQCALVVIWTRARLGLGLSDSDATVAPRPGYARAHGELRFETACPLGAPRDTVDQTLYAVLAADVTRAPSDTVWSRYVRRVLDGVRAAFVLPTELPLGAFGYPFALATSSGVANDGGAAVAAPSASTTFTFTLDSAGAVADMRVMAASLSGAVDTSVIAAIAAAGVARGFPVVPASAHAVSPTRFELIVSIGRAALGDAVTILGRVSAPVWPLARPASVAPGPQPNLGPPPGSTSPRGETAALQFVVDESGRAVVTTALLTSAGDTTGDTADPDFVQRLFLALPKFHFEPALIGTCPVPEITTKRFSWTP